MRRSFIVLSLMTLILAACFAVPGLVPARAQVGASTGTSTPTPTATYAAPTVPPATTATAVSVTAVGTVAATPTGTTAATPIPTATPCTGSTCIPTAASAVVQTFTVRHQGKTALLHWVLGVKVPLKGFRVYAGTHQVSHGLIRPHASLAYHYRTAWTGRRQYVLHVLLKNGLVGIAFSK